MTEHTDTVAVTQADRDAAVSLCVSQLGEHDYLAEPLADIAQGRADNSKAVQAFARHRLASTPKAERDGVLEAMQRCPNCGVKFQRVLDVDAHWAALQSTPSDAVLDREGVDSPTAFENWWDTSPRRNPKLIGYSDKKCLAFEAFEAGLALRATPSPSGEVERLREALQKIYDLPGELNLSNYNDDDVRELNENFVDAIVIAERALARTALDTGNLSDEGVR